MEDSYGLDTNIMIYYLTGKPEEKYKKCLSLIKRAEDGEVELNVLPINFWEATWVLEKFYKNDRKNIVDVLQLFLRLTGIKCKNQDVVLAALNLWEKEKIDFADAYIIESYKSEQVMDIYTLNYSQQYKNRLLALNNLKVNLNDKFNRIILTI